MTGLQRLKRQGDRWQPATVKSEHSEYCNATGYENHLYHSAFLRSMYIDDRDLVLRLVEVGNRSCDGLHDLAQL